VRRALELTRTLSLSAPAKLEAMANRVCADGRLRGELVYGGAERTLRWSSFGVQVHNMKRGMGVPTDAAFEALRAGVLSEVFAGYERPAPEVPADEIALIGEMLRGFLLGPMLVGDFGQIEARTLAWIAGQKDLLKIFADKGDPYCVMATKIYGKPITKKDKMERFLGKQATLAAGYGLSHKRFREMLDETYDVLVDETFAKRVIYTYRNSVPAIIRFWKVLEDCFVFVITNRSQRVKAQEFSVHMGSETIADKFFVWVELPSGRRLWYPLAHMGEGRRIHYWGQYGNTWMKLDLHGGKICGHVCQATARDLLAEAMLRLDAAGFRMLLTVHDEVVAEDDGEPGRLEEFQRIMCEIPPWAAGMPIEADVFRCTRYRK
jgi:DNA polymerase